MSDPGRTIAIVAGSALVTAISAVVLLLSMCGGLFVGLVVGPNWALPAVAIGTIVGVGSVLKLMALAYRAFATDYENVESRLTVMGLTIASVALSVAVGWIWLGWRRSIPLATNLTANLVADAVGVGALVAIVALGWLLPKRAA